MASYGQQVAYRTQETFIRLTSAAWTPLEASSTWPASNSATAPLANRFAVKVAHVGNGGANRVALTYDNTKILKHANHWIGAGGIVVEPASTGLTLYGRAKLAAGVNTIRVVVTEYGY